MTSCLHYHEISHKPKVINLKYFFFFFCDSNGGKKMEMISDIKKLDLFVSRLNEPFPGLDNHF